MNVDWVEPFGREELLDGLRQTRLRDGEPLYSHARLGLAPAMDTGRLAPAQRYVLRPGVAKILELRTALLEHGIDVFALDGGVRIRSSDAPDEVIPVIPPIVEDSIERDGRRVMIVSDGMHRVYAARSLGDPISVVTVHGVPAEHPYYAHALLDGWDGVTIFDELPDDFEKKEYRRPQSYQSLFRDYNAIFPGVQKPRKATNPVHLIA
jgi:hypothetical protein